MPQRRSIAALAANLTPRDRKVVRLVWEHRVLTVPQIARIAFDSEDTARKRLLQLHRLGLVERFRPSLPLGEGSAPFHYILARTGAAVLAAEDDTDAAAFGHHPERARAIAHSQRLAHTIGVNGFFADLTAAARNSPTSALLTWMTEHRCKVMWGEYTRPDAYGKWREDGQTVDFFLEYDTGTEPLDRVLRKLGGYADLATATGIITPVLFWLHSSVRESNLRHRLHKPHPPGIVPVATGSRSPLASANQDGPAGAVWLPSTSRSPRRALAELSDGWSDYECFCGSKELPLW